MVIRNWLQRRRAQREQAVREVLADGRNWYAYDLSDPDRYRPTGHGRLRVMERP